MAERSSRAAHSTMVVALFAILKRHRRAVVRDLIPAHLERKTGCPIHKTCLRGLPPNSCRRRYLYYILLRFRFSRRPNDTRRSSLTVPFRGTSLSGGRPSPVSCAGRTDWNGEEEVLGV